MIFLESINILENTYFSTNTPFDFTEYLGKKDVIYLLGHETDSYFAKGRLFSIEVKDKNIIFDYQGQKRIIRNDVIIFLRSIFEKVETSLSKKFYPFFGYFSYEALQYFNDVKITTKDYFNLPDIYLVFPEEFFHFSRIDHSKFKVVHKMALDGKTQYLEKKIEGFSSIQDMGLSYERYSKDLSNIKERILSGDVYQVNYTHCLQKKSNVNGFDVFKKMFQENPAEYFSYINAPNIEIISSSPELFLKLDSNKKLIGRPIKGTEKRGKCKKTDDELLLGLLNSEKNKAELSMIVDLFRNDFHRVCLTKSVVVEKHLQFMALKNIFHLYSEIHGELKNEKDSLDVLKAIFPSGSITGCPKIKSIEIISELEQRHRSVYCGSIGLISLSEMNLNVAIRTLIKKGRNYFYQTGGGIVYDSKIEEEYQETIAKSETFLKVFREKNESILFSEENLC